VLQSIGAGVYERARSCSERVNERISDSSECSDVSELLFERALRQSSLAVRVRLAHCCSVASFVAVVIGFVASCMLHATSFMF